MPKHFVRIAGLKDGEHRQSFKIEGTFFEAYEKSEIEEGEFIVTSLLKTQGLDRKLAININGTIKNLLCDYCAENLNCKISTCLHFIIKESEEEVESVDEIIYVAPKQHQLNINQLIFEMISLSVPNKKYHRKHGKINCDRKMLSLIEKYATNQKQDTDPRWEGLKKLK